MNFDCHKRDELRTIKWKWYGKFWNYFPKKRIEIKWKIRRQKQQENIEDDVYKAYKAKREITENRSSEKWKQFYSFETKYIYIFSFRLCFNFTSRIRSVQRFQSHHWAIVNGRLNRLRFIPFGLPFFSLRILSFERKCGYLWFISFFDSFSYPSFHLCAMSFWVFGLMNVHFPFDNEGKKEKNRITQAQVDILQTRHRSTKKNLFRFVDSFLLWKPCWLLVNRCVEEKIEEKNISTTRSEWKWKYRRDWCEVKVNVSVNCSIQRKVTQKNGKQTLVHQVLPSSKQKM